MSHPFPPRTCSKQVLTTLLTVGLMACAEPPPPSSPSPTPRVQAAESAKPNIVVIMVDDLDNHTLKVMTDYNLMPFFQEHILGRGLRFTESFVTNSLCCPSRATFLTGQYSHNTGVLTNAYPQGGVEKLVDAHTLPVWLKAAGYRTGFVGKYLNGYGWAGIPPDGTTPRHPALDARYVPPGWDDWQGLVDPSTYQVFNYKLNDNGTVVTYGDTPEEYQTDVLAQRARDFIHEAEALDDAKPFFLTVTPLAPHVEVFNYSPSSYADVWRWFIRPDPKDYTEKSQAMNTIGNIPLWPALKPSFNEDNLTDKPQWVQEHRPVMTSEDISYLTRQYRSRLASMLAVDDLIGAVVQALSANGELENTVLIFTSDNGFMYGEHRMAEKLALYEESIRVPLYIRAPGMTGPSQVDALVLNNDLAPTIASLAGATAEGLVMDGRSLREFLEGQTPSSWRKRFLVEHWPSSSSELDLPAYVAVRSGPTATHVPEMVWAEYRYYGTPFAWEQYDLRTDPLQMNSLHADTSEARQAQRATLDYWLRHLQDCANGSCQFYESL